MKDNNIAFVDTNILVYAFDESYENRRNPCSELVRSGFQGDAEYFVSNQVLSELYVVLTSHVRKPLSKEKGSLIVTGFLDSAKWKKLNYTTATVKRALQDSERINISFWDMLIAETMKEASVRLIYTENERDFRKIPWVQSENPMLMR